MRIAFVESRDKTTLFRAVAKMLPYDVHWLVQNAAFAHDEMSSIYQIPYPARSDLRVWRTDDPVRSEIFERVAVSDRVPLYFSRGVTQYDYYYDQISEWFDRVRPQLLIGEAGAFWSHIVAKIAAHRGIPFLNPLSSRYPTGRFAFFQSDRLVPVGGENPQISTEELQQIVEAINSGKTRPDYMSARRSRASALAARSALLLQWVRGERYTAQSPLQFARAMRELRANRARWDAAATPVEGLGSSKAVLYPLQLQPEMNLDVWGYEYRDQFALIRTLVSEFSSKGYEIWVKPNPKSFYELSTELTSFVRDHPAVKLIAHDVRMPDVEGRAEIVVTVTGSIAIERLLKNDPIAVLHEDYASWIGAPSPLDFGLTSANLRAEPMLGQADASTEKRPTEVVRRLISTSYRGVISEPSYMPGVLEGRNVSRIASAVEDVVGQLQKRGEIHD